MLERYAGCLQILTGIAQRTASHNADEPEVMRILRSSSDTTRTRRSRDIDTPKTDKTRVLYYQCRLHCQKSSRNANHSSAGDHCIVKVRAAMHEMRIDTRILRALKARLYANIAVSMTTTRPELDSYS